MIVYIFFDVKMVVFLVVYAVSESDIPEIGGGVTVRSITSTETIRHDGIS
jgi:hypothetical protein